MTKVCTKYGFFYNFVENIINPKSNDCSCISWYMVTYDAFKVLNLHWTATLAIVRTLKTSLVPIYPEMHERSYDFLYQMLHQGRKCHQRRKAALSRKFYKGRKCNIKVESVIKIGNATRVKIWNVALT